MIYLQVILSGLLLGSMYALLGVGLTLVFGVSRVVNFAHGDFVAVGMYLTVVLSGVLGVDPYLTTPLVAVAMAIFGWIVAKLVIARTMRHATVVQIFATVGLGLVIQNSLLLIFGGSYRSVRTALDGTIALGAIRLPIPLVVAFFVSLVMVAAIFLFLGRTDTGRAIRATAENRRAASLMGINGKRIDTTTFVIGSTLTGVAAVLFMPVYSAFPTVGIGLNLIAFVVVVLGGLGSVQGALVGGLAVGVFESLSGYMLGSGFRQIAYFIVFVVVLVVRPRGLLGIRGAEEVGFR